MDKKNYIYHLGIRNKLNKTNNMVTEKLLCCYTRLE